VSAVPPTKVRFRIGDVIHPSGAVVLWELYSRLILSGELLAITDDDRGAGNVLILQVEGLDEPVLLPRDKALPGAVVPAGENHPRAV
jgi:hypothetical protein